MLKKIMLVGAFLAASICAAIAAQGFPPQNGFGMPDGTWLNGVAAGLNSTFVSGVAAAGSNQATSTQLLPGLTLIEVDSGTGGVALPAGLAGTEVSIFNNTGATINVFPSIANNGATGSQDTINAGTSFTGGMATHTSLYCFSAKTGAWACK